MTALLLLYGIFPATANSLDVDGFFRPVTSRDLVTKLPPRLDLDRNFDRDTISLDSQNGACPDEILIGSVDENTDVFGDIEIDVFIGDDVFINCGGR